jgi:Lon protease-like protein
MDHDFPGLENFSGIARLFPLPNVVLFPFIMQALHIFEPRYRQMTADALAGDRLITMALLRPGWEADYKGRPAVYPVACIGRIVAHQRLDDGRYNLQLRGVSRVRLIQEIETDKLYRSARVEVLSDIPVGHPEIDQELRRRLRRIVPKWHPAKEPETGFFKKLLASNLPFGMIGDLLASMLPVTVEVKQRLLETLDVEQRIGYLLEYLEGELVPSLDPDETRRFPPDFSVN